VDVHTICLIGGITLYCVLAFYLLWNIFFSYSSYLSRLRRPSRSGRGGVLSWNHNNWYQSIQIVSQHTQQERNTERAR